MKCSCLMTHLGRTVSASLVGSYYRKYKQCRVLPCFIYTMVSWLKQSTCSPPQTGSACRAQSRALLSIRCQVKVRKSAPRPTLLISWAHWFSGPPHLQPPPLQFKTTATAPCPSPLQPELQPQSHPDLLQGTQNKRSLQKHLFKAQNSLWLD